MTKRDDAIEEILSCLYDYGAQYLHAGKDLREIAAQWYDAGFAGMDEVSEWKDIFVWDPWTAAVLVRNGMRPADVQAVADAMLEAHGDDVYDVYTLGDPIYACCNGDLSPEKLIEFWQDMQR